jgi:hypothetical protein
MNYPYLKYYLFLIIIYFTPFISAQSTPEEIVMRYCTMRFDETDMKNLNEYKKLQVWGENDDEPGWDRAFIDDTFSIIKSKHDGYLTYVDVSFKTYGVYDGGKWLPYDTSGILQYILVNTVEGWKIIRTGENPRISIEASIKDSDKNLEELYKAYQSFKSNKVVYDEYKTIYNDRAMAFSELKKLAEKRRQEHH